MRLWENEPPGETKPETCRDYETVGFVLGGGARLHMERQTVELRPSDCGMVPQGAAHHYEVVEPFAAVEATSPPARVHARENRMETTFDPRVPRCVVGTTPHERKRAPAN